MKPTLEQQSPTADEVARAIEWAKREMADRDYCAERRASSPELVAACGRDKRHLEVLVTAAKGADAKGSDFVWIVGDRMFRNEAEADAYHDAVWTPANRVQIQTAVIVPYGRVDAALAAKESP